MIHLTSLSSCEGWWSIGGSMWLRDIWHFLPSCHFHTCLSKIPLSLSLPLLDSTVILNDYCKSEFLKDLKEMSLGAVIWCYLHLHFVPSLFFYCFACRNAFAIFLHLYATVPRSSKSFQGQWEVLPSEREKTAWSDPRNCTCTFTPWESFWKQETGVKPVILCDCKRFNVNESIINSTLDPMARHFDSRFCANGPESLHVDHHGKCFGNQSAN